MKNLNLPTMFSCPRCNTPKDKLGSKGTCKSCGYKYNKIHGIWKFLNIVEKNSKKSAAVYESMHSRSFIGPADGSYKILAAFAKGNKAIDIACGSGEILELAPETVGVDFSINALKKAKRRGAKYLVLADAHSLPFQDDTFDLAISSGNLEHFADPQKAIDEMARVSKMQVIVVHRKPPIPFYGAIEKFISKVAKIKHQPIEKPISERKLVSMLNNANLHIVYKGVWTLPTNYGRVINFLPELHFLPCCNFVITVRKN